MHNTFYFHNIFSHSFSTWYLLQQNPTNILQTHNLSEGFLLLYIYVQWFRASVKLFGGFNRKKEIREEKKHTMLFALPFGLLLSGRLHPIESVVMCAVSTIIERFFDNLCVWLSWLRVIGSACEPANKLILVIRLVFIYQNKSYACVRLSVFV